jgi:hypothetical protein
MEEPDSTTPDMVSYVWIKRARRIQLQPYEFEEIAVALYVRRDHLDFAQDELERKLDDWENFHRSQAQPQERRT